MLACGVGGNDGRDPTFVQWVDQMSGIVSRVGHDDLHRQALEQVRGSRDIAGLSRRQLKAGQVPEPLDQCVDLGAQPPA